MARGVVSFCLPLGITVGNEVAGKRRRFVSFHLPLGITVGNEVAGKRRHFVYWELLLAMRVLSSLYHTVTVSPGSWQVASFRFVYCCWHEVAGKRRHR